MSYINTRFDDCSFFCLKGNPQSCLILPACRLGFSLGLVVVKQHKFESKAELLFVMP